MRLTSRTALDWGLTDFSTLSGQLAPSAVVPLPSQRFVRTLGVETMLDLTHAFSRRPQLPVAASATTRSRPFPSRWGRRRPLRWAGPPTAPTQSRRATRMGAARTNQLLFTGWQFQALVGLRWEDRGSF